MKSITGGAPEIRIKDVAQAAGVSVATISRVINDTGPVNEATRERVLEVISSLGYRPNLLARNLRKQKSLMLGVVIGDIENPHYTAMVRVVEDAAYDSGYRVLLCNTDGSATKQRAYLRLLAAERMSGVIVAPSDPDDPELGHLLDLGIPVAAFDRPISDPRAHAILSDSRAAAALATRHLIERGYTSIGLVGGPERLFTGRERTAGYLGEMATHGLEPCHVDGDFRIDGGRIATRELLARRPRVRAIVLGNNLMSIGALEEIYAAGLRIPEDVALTAIDDPFWTSAVRPRLTALAQPVREMSRAAVDCIAGRHEEPRRLIYEFELRVRDSCGSEEGP